MDGFTGFKTATTEELPDAVAVMDPFHVVRLAGDALPVPAPGPAGHPRPPRLRATRSTRRAGPCTPAPACSPTSRPSASRALRRRRLVEVEATWGIYQRMIAAYRDARPASWSRADGKLIDRLSTGVPPRWSRSPRWVGR